MQRLGEEVQVRGQEGVALIATDVVGPECSSLEILLHSFKRHSAPPCNDD